MGSQVTVGDRQHPLQIREGDFSADREESEDLGTDRLMNQWVKGG